MAQLPNMIADLFVQANWLMQIYCYQRGIVLFQIDFFLYKSDLKYSGNRADISINKDLVRNKKTCHLLMAGW